MRTTQQEIEGTKEKEASNFIISKYYKSLYRMKKAISGRELVEEISMLPPAFLLSLIFFILLQMQPTESSERRTMFLSQYNCIYLCAGRCNFLGST